MATLHDVLARSRDLGLLGPGQVDDHIGHAQVFVDLVEQRCPAGRILDLGSGGGVPGLILADRLPDLRLTLLDASERRCAVLRDAVRRLGVDDRATVVVGRAETVAWLPEHRGQYDLVVARSFGPPAVTAECATAFAKITGAVLVSEPVDDPDRWSSDALDSLGLVVGPLHIGDSGRVRELCRIEADLSSIPRSIGIPTRRPAF